VGDPSKIKGGTAVKSNVSLAQASTEEAVLPARIQEALGQLVGAAKEGLLALSVGVGLGVLSELLEEEGRGGAALGADERARLRGGGSLRGEACAWSAPLGG
jgi:hypothetical protein